MNITFNINNENLQDITDTIKWLWSIPKDSNGDNEFTDNQWAKEGLRRWLIVQVGRRKKQVAKDLAETSVNVSDNMIT